MDMAGGTTAANFQSYLAGIPGLGGANAVLVPEKLEFGAVYLTSLAVQRDFAVNGLMVKIVYRF